MSPRPASLAPRLPGRYAAVVADMDGLLVHTERQWLQAKVILFGRYGVKLTEADRAAVFGAADSDTAAYFAERFGMSAEQVPDLREEYLAIIADLFAGGVEVTPGAAELIDRMAGVVPLALASNTRRSLVELVLGSTPFGHRFDVIVTGDEAAPKPAPDLYLLACARLGVEPAAAVALEDSPTGVAAAKAAGLTCIGVPSDPDTPLHQADIVIGSLAGLL